MSDRSVDYRKTISLPRSSFPMRGRLSDKEPEILALWKEMGLSEQLRAQSRDRAKYVLHDGPPYANGHLHMGHALNKVLKDMINRYQQMQGRNAHFLPGWDCHGLPIEWKIEEELRAGGREKKALSAVAFRGACRRFAAHWTKVQAQEFRRLGVEADFAHAYTTMSFEAEAQIVREIGKFLCSGALYRGSRPVLWSVPERTALADAEVEYRDITSSTIWVCFPLLQVAGLTDVDAVIWTTTPWTLPGNRAIAYAEDTTYAVLEVGRARPGDRFRTGQRFLVAASLAETFARTIGLHDWHVRTTFSSKLLCGVVARHPLRGFPPLRGSLREGFLFEGSATKTRTIFRFRSFPVRSCAPNRGRVWCTLLRDTERTTSLWDESTTWKSRRPFSKMDVLLRMFHVLQGVASTTTADVREMPIRK